MRGRGEDWGGGGEGAPQNEGPCAAMELEEGLLGQLVPMGFPRELARRAVRSTGYAGVDEALTWLGDRAAASAESSFAASAQPHATDCDEDAVRRAIEADDLDLSGDEALRQAIDASLADAERDRRTQTAVDSFGRLWFNDGVRSDSPMAPPAPPRELVTGGAVAEAILRRLRAKSVSPTVMVKAGLLMRRRAAAARARLQAERNAGERAGELPGARAPAHRLPQPRGASRLNGAAGQLPSGGALQPPSSPREPLLQAPVTAPETDEVTPYETAILRGQERLSERLDQLGLCRLPTKDDGNCQVRAGL